jgi:hypothetical protein
MGRGLKGAPHTYTQSLPPNSQGVARMPSLIGDYNDHLFSVFMDYHGAFAIDFDTLFEFLHTQCLPQCAFRSIYLSGHKTHFFSHSLDILRLLIRGEDLKPSQK